jgi:uncharacterized damage-inducible protein DinB
VDIGQAFIDRSVAYLKGDYLPRIHLCLQGLSEEDIWWRPNEASNSIGNLILHLAGNAKQWVVSGIGGEPDRRRRDEEFSQSGGQSGAELITLLEGALDAVDEVLSRLEPPELLETRVIQGMTVSVLDALYHVVEHFSTHTGQIIYLAKLRTGRDLGFWDVKDGKAVRKW